MVILGSTGSIGKNAVFIAQKFKIGVEALACDKNYKLLNEQISALSPKFVYIKEPSLAKFVTHKRVFSGNEGMARMLEMCQSELVINAIVGFAGLKGSLLTQNLGKKLALANKESLVVAGKFLKTKEIFPIDSEHFGLKFLLKGAKTKPKKLIITASGGAFYRTPLSKLEFVTPQMALNHPNWSMGAKITIDSATMANKLFEILEAFWLYEISQIDALIEPTSTIHALVDFTDGSTTAHISCADMKLAIAHAIKPSFDDEILPSVELKRLCAIKFKDISLKKYPIFTLKNALLENPNLGVIINAANEVGVEAFLGKKIKFTDIAKVIFSCLDKFDYLKADVVEEIFKIDEIVRDYAKKGI